MKQSLLIFIMIAAAVFAFQNCGTPNISTQVDKDAKSFTVDAQKLVTMVSQDLSCNVDSDCEGLTYGAKACGGPSKAIVISKLNPGYNDIITLANSISQQEFAFNQATGAVSTCSILLAPIPHCISNSCQ